MPPIKRAALKTSSASATSTTAKRESTFSVSESIQVPAGETSSTRGTVPLDVPAFSAALSAAVSKATKPVFSPENIAVLLESSRAPQPVLPVARQDSPGAVDKTVSTEDNSSGTDKGGPRSLLVSSDSRLQTAFTSISVPPSSRASSKDSSLKAKYSPMNI